MLWMWWILKYLKGKICSQISISVKSGGGSALDVVDIEIFRRKKISISVKIGRGSALDVVAVD